MSCPYCILISSLPRKVLEGAWLDSLPQTGPQSNKGHPAHTPIHTFSQKQRHFCVTKAPACILYFWIVRAYLHAHRINIKTCATCFYRYCFIDIILRDQGSFIILGFCWHFFQPEDVVLTDEAGSDSIILVCVFINLFRRLQKALIIKFLFKC